MTTLDHLTGRTGAAVGPTDRQMTAWDSDPVFACEGAMAEAMRRHPWVDTPIGPPCTWPEALRTTVSLMLRSRYPMILSWSTEFVVLYNDAYIPTLGAKHPCALGRRLADVFSEIWDAIGPMQTSVLMGAPATWDEDLPLVIERGSGPEETFFTFSYSPVPDGQHPGGVLAVLSDTTPQVVGARRLELLKDVGATSASDVREAARRLVEALSRHPSEVPAARVWLRGEQGLEAVASFGELAAAGEVADLPSLHRGTGVDGRPERVGLDFATDGGTGVLELALPALRRFDLAHEEFLDQLGTLVGQQMENAAARGQEIQRGRALSDLVHARTQFLSTMSHELRTPLTLILGPLQDALRGELPVVSGTQVADLHRQAQRLLGMVDDLLEVSRAEAGELTRELLPVAVGQYTSTLVAPMAEAAARAGLAFDADLSCPDVVLLDLRHWDNIVLNLVTNAIKYTLDGRVELRLRVAESLELVVRDTGIGIAAEQQPSVFERFHRVRTGAGRSIEGAGVGLAIVAGAVESLDGTLSLESREGEGTTITVTLPLHRAAATAGATPSERRLDLAAARAADLVPRGRALAASSEVPAGDGPLILVVDDNVAMQEYVASCLGDLGRVVVADDGIHALELLDEHPVDLVVSDVMMPRLDGHGLVAGIRASSTHSDLPVVLLSARAGSDAVVEGMGSGADDYLQKPFGKEELQARVRAHLELSRLRREAQRRRDRETMLAGVSHDMQTPLARLATSLEVLGVLGVSPAAGPVMGTMVSSVGELRALVGEFLDWSALAVGQALSSRRDLLDLAELVESMPRPAGLDVTVSGPRDLLVVGDVWRVRRIVTNLLTNAAQAGASSVHVELSRAGSMAVVAVRDDGPGLPAGMEERLFEAWRTSRGPDGAGLGLFISRESARAMDGDLRLRSSGPSGAGFELLLPAGLLA